MSQEPQKVSYYLLHFTDDETDLDFFAQGHTASK